MGLDMYIYQRKKESAISNEEAKTLVKCQREAQAIEKDIEAKCLEAVKKFKVDTEEYYDAKNSFMNSEYVKEKRNVLKKLNKTVSNITLVEEVAYFRKHPDLHGLIEKKWREAGNEGEFNCQKFVLSKEFCNELLEIAKNPKDVETTTGFFFGTSCDEDWKDTVVALEKALEILKDDTMEVFYDSWW